MTFAEVNRFFRSRKRVILAQERKQASFDYLLADTIGRSVARVYNKTNKMPDIGEVYPSLFDSAEIKEQKLQKKQELSALRFKQFAHSYNARYKEVAKET